MAIKHSKIVAFWDWFQKILPQLAEGDIDDNLIEELDIKILDLGPFSWEIGPGLIDNNSFVISPSGNIELLGQTKEIVSMAPKIEGWELYYFKPPKEWMYKFSFIDDNHNEINVDANSWEYVLLKYDNTFDIYINGACDNLSETNWDTAVEILLIGILGEEEFLKRIEYFEVVKEFDDKFKGKQSNIKNLKAHLLSLK